MYDALEQALSSADWETMSLRLLDYADRLIRRCFWRGIPVTAKAGARLSVGGWDADDFLQEAIDRLLNGQRLYRADLSLEQVLRGTIRSLVWSSNKSSHRQPLLDVTHQIEGGDACVGIDATDPAPAADGSLLFRERVAQQRVLLRAFEESLDQPELKQLVEALKRERYAPRDIEAATGIPAQRVSELKRQLRRRMDAFATDYPHGDCLEGILPP